MNDYEAGRCWESNAEAWTRLARAGWDVFRDHINTPAFFEMLPPVAGLRGLDIGCGEGHNTRLLKERGAAVYAFDIAPAFVRRAAEAGGEIAWAVASAQALPFPSGAFDFATAFMTLMDVPAPDEALRETARVLKPGGWLQFSISHPCFDTPHRRKVRDANGRAVAIETGGYFDKTPVWIDE